MPRHDFGIVGLWQSVALRRLLHSFSVVAQNHMFHPGTTNACEIQSLAAIGSVGMDVLGAVRCPRKKSQDATSEIRMRSPCAHGTK